MVEKEKMKQSRILLITGILLIIRGMTFVYVTLPLLDILYPPCCPFCSPWYWDFYREYIDPIFSGMSDIEFGLLPYILLFFLLGGILSLIVGIMGILHWRKPGRGKRCLIWGIAAATVYPFLFWWGATRAVAHPDAFWFVRIEVGIAFLFVYALYIFGAYRLNKRKEIAS